MKDWQKWFRDKRSRTIDIHEVLGGESTQAYRTQEITVEELYQAFKARMEFETREN